MPNPDMNPDKDVVLDSDGRLAGCRGRALVAVVLAVFLFLLLCAALVWGLRSERQPLPATAPATSDPPAKS